MKIAIIQFGGSNCDYDVHYVLTSLLGVKASLLWYKDAASLKNYDGIVIPGGFSYGDYLRAGAIAARTPIMAQVKQKAAEGKPIIGICNGFQILTEAQLLPGALTLNQYPKFICTTTHLRVENNNTPFTNKFKQGEILQIPVAHMEGNYYADTHTLAQLNRDQQIALRYVNPAGEVSEDANPNGSKENIAGVLNQNKNILGLMPHPERASEEILGSSDGLKIFQSMIEYAEAHAEY
jgi:phosphoribosylformylglycinamidine synthase